MPNKLIATPVIAGLRTISSFKFLRSARRPISGWVIENFSDNRSFANGVYMAISFILHSIAILLVGYLSDLVDLRFTFLISAGVLPLGLLFINLLPKANGNANRLG